MMDSELARLSTNGAQEEGRGKMEEGKGVTEDG
jgi:hypothetical protein